MEKKENMEEKETQASPIVNPEEERTRPQSGQEMDHETIQILLDDRISTGG